MSQLFEKERRKMVSDQIIKRDLASPKVLQVMATVPREEFVPAEHLPQSYHDTPLPIGFGQTISQPFTVAFMVDALQLSGDEKVLEIGTGSGYQAAVLSQLAKEIHTVERIPELCEEAKNRLQRLGYENVYVHPANGTLGWPKEAPFDAIAVTAGAEELPPPYRDQLAEGGRILIPLGSYRIGQRMFRYTLNDGKLAEEDLGGFAFVPLIGEFGWNLEE